MKIKHKTLKSMLVIIISTSLWATPLTLAAVVGTTTGVFEVGSDGSANYRVPIEIPPGTAGMEPRLALTYNSNAGNGLLGMGWSLTGLSQVSRCPSTFDPDGFFRGIEMNVNDRLCLDGARLISVSGEYGKLNAEYRTEIEQFAKVTQHGGHIQSSRRPPQFE